MYSTAAMEAHTSGSGSAATADAAAAHSSRDASPDTTAAQVSPIRWSRSSGASTSAGPATARRSHSSGA